MSDPKGTQHPPAPPPNVPAPNLPPERPNRNLPVQPPRAMLFPDSKFTAYCDRCGLLIRKEEPRVNESTTKEERAAKDWGRRWHVLCYEADGQPLGAPGLYDLPYAAGQVGDGGRAGGRPSTARGA